MSTTTRPVFTRTEPELLAILLWRDLWVAEIELREQSSPIWRRIDESLLEARANLLVVMNPRDRGECEATTGSFRLRKREPLA
jgi:hypothetical protein